MPELRKDETKLVTCATCGRAILHPIPKGVTGDFYCSDECHADRSGNAGELAKIARGLEGNGDRQA